MNWVTFNVIFTIETFNLFKIVDTIWVFKIFINCTWISEELVRDGVAFGSDHNQGVPIAESKNLFKASLPFVTIWMFYDTQCLKRENPNCTKEQKITSTTITLNHKKKKNIFFMYIYFRNYFLLTNLLVYNFKVYC